jgi:hypothetical protein
VYIHSTAATLQCIGISRSLVTYFTTTDTIPFVSEDLPVHYTRILVAVELKNTPHLEADGKTYTFEGDVSGYYNDPTPPSLRNDKLYKSKFTQTTTQYFYAEINPRLERVLGSTNMHASSKVFVDGDYRFPVEQNSIPGYIEVRNVSFNATNRTIQGGNAANGTGASGGSGGNRHNVILKSSPAKSRYTPGGSSQAGPSRSTSPGQATASASHRETSSRGFDFTAGGASANNTGSIGDMFSIAEPSAPNLQCQGFAGPEFQAIPGSSATVGDDKTGMSFALGAFDVDPEVGVPVPEGRSIVCLESIVNSRDLQNKRGSDTTSSPEACKRQRKPSSRAKERDRDIV